MKNYSYISLIEGSILIGNIQPMQKTAKKAIASTAAVAALNEYTIGDSKYSVDDVIENVKVDTNSFFITVKTTEGRKVISISLDYDR